MLHAHLTDKIIKDIKWSLMHKYFKSVSSVLSVFYSYLYWGFTTPEGMPIGWQIIQDWLMIKYRNNVLKIIKNKYFLTLLIFTVWLFLFDSNNLIDRFHDQKRLRQLESDKEYYQESIQEDSEKLNELKTNKENLEKFAREQYLMKKTDEEIFVIIKEDKKK